jgi:hypothetical protein
VVGERDDAEEVDEELLKRPSIFMSLNRNSLEPSMRLMTSPYSSPSKFTAASSKSTIAAGADTSFDTINA